MDGEDLKEDGQRVNNHKWDTKEWGGRVEALERAKGAGSSLEHATSAESQDTSWQSAGTRQKR